MELDDVTVTLKKLRRKVAKGSSPALKREQVLYSALLDLVEYVEELDINSDLASIGDFGPRLRRLEEQVARLQERGE